MVTKILAFQQPVRSKLKMISKLSCYVMNKHEILEDRKKFEDLKVVGMPTTKLILPNSDFNHEIVLSEPNCN